MAAAAFDMVRQPFARTSQMVIVAKRAPELATPENAGKSVEAGQSDTGRYNGDGTPDPAVQGLNR
jgi:hypothetical protein